MGELPVFSLNRSFNPQDAWHDKIDLAYSPVIMTDMDDEATGEDASNFLYCLSCPDKFTRDSQEERSIAFGWLFNSTASIRAGYSRKIRESSLRWGNPFVPRPLFTGEVRLDRIRDERKVNFVLHLNPTRFLHHYPTRAADYEDYWLHSGVLSETSRCSSFEGEFSLDGNDNWIPQGRDYRQFWRRPSQTHRRFFEIVRGALQHEIDRAGATSCTIFRTNTDSRYSIQKLETYWEFLHDSPSRLVSSLKNHLIKFSRKGFHVRAYPQRSLSRESLNKNCLSITVPLARGEDLVIYAKTNRRVRFEIRQDFRANSKCLGNRITASSVRRLNEVLNQARIHCAARMNEVFEYMRNQTAVESDAVSVTSFLADLASALRTSQYFPDILSILLSHGKIERVAALDAEIQALRKAGIIEGHGPVQNRSYGVCSRYRIALKKLQRKGLASELGTRDR